MFTGRIPRIISSATCASRSAIMIPRISVSVHLHGIRASIPIILRNYHEDGSLNSMEKGAPGDKVVSKMRKEENGEKDQREHGVDVGEKTHSKNGEKGKEQVKMKRKTIAEMDEELRAKMEGREGAAGVSYEGGKPVTDGFGRGVKSNMFRVI